ncbi:MAG: hypothetical protein BLITH_1352 [Brockia lithotrophica]|uniref:Uncharacterized protein n=1 Tax=Brockia lithotrophica TaxID=933949 RepID=A0A2T5G6B0_9BACL|nr:MAG: hypothetical protein BLITH_1352 [Brockia lithotrophica]
MRKRTSVAQARGRTFPRKKKAAACAAYGLRVGRGETGGRAWGEQARAVRTAALNAASREYSPDGGGIYHT